jgi:hypothetical protein
LKKIGGRSAGETTQTKREGMNVVEVLLFDRHEETLEPLERVV